MDKLKLIALDAEDLAVLSAHVQDAVLKVADMTFQPQAKRFVGLVRRFDWTAPPAQGTAKAQPLRRQTALRFERVLAARHQGIDLKARAEVLSLLAIQFAAKAPDDPAGTVTLVFAGGGAIQLDVECIEAELRDLGPMWRAKSRPQHPEPAGTPPNPAKGDKVSGEG
ncbi:MAG: DUF2948 family protein [Hyphomicrobiaceae bacterium]